MFKMKNHILSLLLCSALGFSACTSDWLNIDPSTSVTSPQAIRTLEDAQGALNGIYRLAASHSYYGDNYLYYADCRGEDVQAYTSKGSGRRVSPYYEFNVTADDAFNITRVWNQPYIVIHQANSLIEAIEAGKVETNDTKALGMIRAEALVMRALAHFDLTRLFAMPYTFDQGASPGIPVETHTTLPTHQPSRNSVAECYDQVITDMEEALPALSKEKKNGFQNYWSTCALLSRIYLYMNNNEKALQYAEEVMNNGDIYRLYTHDEYSSVWGKDFQSESLFEFYYTLTEPAGGTGGEGAPMVYADITLDWTNLILTEAFLNLLAEDPNDVRHCITKMPVNPDADILPAGSAGKPKYMGKYPGKTGDNPQDNNICIIRLSEVYLNAAEAAFKTGDQEKASVYLNKIVSRANPQRTVSPDEISLDKILTERRKELVGEGHAFFDYIRNKMSISRKGGWHLSSIPTNALIIQPDDKRIALPIPQAEIDANPNMVQNPR